MAAELGWIVAEYGRQPWAIEGILPTALGVSSLTSTQVWISLAGFVLSLALFEQMPATAIAQTLGVSPAGAMRRLRAALRRVGNALEKQEARD